MITHRQLGETPGSQLNLVGLMEGFANNIADVSSVKRGLWVGGHVVGTDLGGKYYLMIGCCKGGRKG